MSEITPLLHEEIVERFTNGEDLIDLSIEKYEHILNIIRLCDEIDIDNIYGDNCPLCMLYSCQYHDGHTKAQCPLEKHDKNCNEDESLWNNIYFSILHGTNDIEDNIKEMIKRLKQIKILENKM